MSWGQELWDQYPSLSDHTQKGIEFLDRYGQFMKERCAIEVEYAGKLKRLAKHYQLKKKDEEDNQYSYCKGFLQMLQEITDMAGQHEVISENITGQIVKEITLQLKELKEERKRYLVEGQKHQSTYILALGQLEKAKKSHEKAFREAEKASEMYQKADADLNLSRAEVEKARMFSIQKGQVCEETKSDYANQLQKTNQLQKSHFTELMPKVFQQLQDMEERRIACIQNYMRQSASIQRQVLPIIDKCLEGIMRASDAVQPKGDSLLVIERYKSGNYPPDDIPFEDLTQATRDTPDTGSSRGSNHLNYSSSIKSETLRGTLSVARLRKRGGLFGIFTSNKNSNNFDGYQDDYAELPPNQRRKKIIQKIDQIQAQINQETAVRDGLMKMKAAYEQNPSMGDPNSVEGQLTENGHRMEKMQAELKKFKGYLEEVDGKPQTPHIQKKQNNRNSISEDSLSRSASDSSFHQQNQTNNHNQQLTRDIASKCVLNNKTSPTSLNHNHNQQNNHPHPVDNNHHLSPSKNLGVPEKSNGFVNSPTEHSPESGISTSHLSIPDADYVDAEEGDVVPDGGDFDPEALPTLGKARALYPFEAQSEGSIGMEEGEELDVVELDQGDGWTRVRRINCDEEGFVPTSYIEVEVSSS